MKTKHKHIYQVFGPFKTRAEASLWLEANRKPYNNGEYIYEFIYEQDYGWKIRETQTF